MARGDSGVYLDDQYVHANTGGNVVMNHSAFSGAGFNDPTFGFGYHTNESITLLGDAGTGFVRNTFLPVQCASPDTYSNNVDSSSNIAGDFTYGFPDVGHSASMGTPFMAIHNSHGEATHSCAPIANMTGNQGLAGNQENFHAANSTFRKSCIPKT